MKELIDKAKRMLLQKDKMLVLILTGILIFVACMPVKPKKDMSNHLDDSVAESAEEDQVTEQKYRKELEYELESLLENMDGVGAVQVMITLKASGQKILAKDNPNSFSSTKEEDAEGGVRNIEEKKSEEVTIYGKNSYGDEMPYVIKQLQPEIEGVFVIAEGGGDENVQLQITEAVQALFGIEAHKIKIAKRKI